MLGWSSNEWRAARFQLQSAAAAAGWYTGHAAPARSLVQSVADGRGALVPDCPRTWLEGTNKASVALAVAFT